MKMKFLFLCPAVLLFAMVFTFSTCEAGTGAYVMNKDAVLTSLTIGSVKPAAAPSPISSLEWNDLDADLSGEGYTLVNLQRDEDMVNVYLKPKASKNARIAWGIGDLITRPAEFYDYRVPATFNNEDYIYIRVTSEDTTRIQYYRFYVFMLKKGTSLMDVTIDGKKLVVDVNAAAGSWDQPNWLSGTIPITIPGSTNAKINTVAFESSSTFKYAKLPEGSTAEPVFGTNDVMDFTDQDILYIEVTAQNDVDKAYYKFLISVGRIANIAKLNFVGLGTNPNTATEVTGKGVPKAVWADVTAGGFESADMPSAGYIIKLELEDPGSSCGYQVVTGTAMPDTWISLPTVEGAGSSTGKAVFDNTNWLAIKVTSENTHGIMYYKINVELLAANFKQHPISAVYYYYKDPDDVEEILKVVTKYDDNGNPEETEELDEGKGKFIDWPDPNQGLAPSDTRPRPPAFFYSDDGSNGGPDNVKDLYVILDRTDGTYTYQWWHANSWYGGYGFDKDGNMCYNIEASNGTQFNWEAAFEEDIDHHREFDEKGNPSLFNGGNQQASYVLRGRPIEGATQETYRPRIDWRPFNSGYSYETHYYWVVVTDTSTNRRATSARATILSERDNRKKHLMIDVNNVWKDANGIPRRFKNTEVFKEQYDKFRIPAAEVGLASPGFNIMNWKVMTAQARFYLTDGTDWIQNWTNGNISFEDNGSAVVPSHGPPPDLANIKGLFYNLTNNNAIYDVTSDVKEPVVGASLDVPFTHLVLEPSGDHTKGPNKDGYPSLVLDTNPQSETYGKMVADPALVNVNLQGWFCGYVELVEFHFEGPR